MPNFDKKLGHLFDLHESLNAENAEFETTKMLRLAKSTKAFHSKDEMQEYLTEGSILNVNTLSSKALSIPCGEYIVWNDQAGIAQLVPTASVTKDPEIYTKQESVNIFRSKLINNWNKLEKSISEAAGDEAEDQDEDTAAEKREQNIKNLRQGSPDEVGIQTFGSEVDNTQFKGAIERADMTLSQVADAVDVDVSTISRMLRDKRPGSGDPKGRLPSIELATKIADVVGTTVDNLGFANRVRKKIKKRRATGGSGTKKGHSALSQKWTAGNKNG